MHGRLHHVFEHVIRPNGWRTAATMSGQMTSGFTLAVSEKVKANNATSPLAFASLSEFGRLRSSVE